MKEIIAGLIGIYTGGLIGTLILFTAGKIGIFTSKRRAHRRSIYKTSI